MINYHYQLVSPRKIVKKVFDENIRNKIIAKPTYMSICAADQRYFQGKRDINILQKKLPMALIHEAVGIVVNDTKKFKKGDKVVLLPNITNSECQNENYQYNSKFMSSNIDGFMQEKIIISDNQAIKYNRFLDDKIMVFSELLSVAIHAVESVKNQIKKSKIIGIWGDGNLGYLIHLYLSRKYPEINIYVFGTNDEKLEYFGNAKKRINIYKNKIESVDLAFEAVGGNSSSKAINQIIDTINVVGTIVLLGVSEELININTRLILEKGITLIGRSRSTKKDFLLAIKFLTDKKNQNAIRKIINKEFVINKIEDIEIAFDYDYTHNWKTIIKWNM